MEDRKFKHLNESNMEQVDGNRWAPAIPLPYYTSRKRNIFGKTTKYGAQCTCGARFDSEAEYKLHYRTEQLLEMNKIYQKTRDMQHGKALFWRRAFFIMRHGRPSERKAFIDEFDRNFWPEAVNQRRLDTCNARLEPHWEPVYERYQRKTDRTIGQAIETAEIEDETPEEAAQTMDQPFSYTNSKGEEFFLHSKIAYLRASKPVRIYFFAKQIRPDLSERRFPTGYKIVENPRNGFLSIQREEKDVEVPQVTL